MNDIDFLPVAYRQMDAKRQVNPWRTVVVGAVVAMLAIGAMSQYCQRRRTEDELAAVGSFHSKAVADRERLADFQARLQSAQGEADLLTYLRHPWPRSQLLSAVAAPVPKEVTLYQIQIATESQTDAPLIDQRPRGDRKAEEEKLRKLSPAQRDAKRLREECDKAQTLVRLGGATTDTAALYRYLGVLGKSSLLAKVQLRSIESIEGPQGTQLRFQASALVQPGYDQPGGPYMKKQRAESKERRAESKSEPGRVGPVVQSEEARHERT